MQVGFICTVLDTEKSQKKDESISKATLSSIGVEILDPIRIDQDDYSVSRIKSVLYPSLEDYFPETIYRNKANLIVKQWGADAVLVPWSEKTTQIFADTDVVKVAYYGNPDPKNYDILSKPPFRKSQGLLRDFIHLIRRRHVKRFHFQEMRKYDLFGNLAANDVEYYKTNGIKNAFYIRMVFPDYIKDKWESIRDELENKTEPERIVANIGRQNSTGNTLALEYLADHILDPLKKTMIGHNYHVYLLGGGKIFPHIEKKLLRPEVKNLGFIDDIDTFLLSTKVFLCLNNATEYKVNQSRYLHIWSLGGCIVAHKDAQLSLPEMKHRENALLGSNDQEIAELVLEACDNLSLRRQLGNNGYQCFKNYFTAEKVSADLFDRLTIELHKKHQ